MHTDVEQFVTWGLARGWKPATAGNVRFNLRTFTGFLASRGCRSLVEVGAEDIDAYMQAQRDQRLAAATRHARGQAIRSFFRWLSDRGRILINPAARLPLPLRTEAVLPPPPLSEEEVAGILNHLPRGNVSELRTACLLELLYGCGLRLSEALKLNLSDLDFRRRTVSIHDGKHGQSRLIPLPATAQAAVKTYQALRSTQLRGPDHGALFLDRSGRRWKASNIYPVFRRINAGRGSDAVHLHPHLLRHSIAVHLLRRGADIRYIQQFLGHACLDTTKIYLRLVPGQLREDYDAAMPWIDSGCS